MRCRFLSLSKDVLPSWRTGKQAPPPRPPSPDFAGILGIPAAKSARQRFFPGKTSTRGRRTRRRTRLEFERQPSVFSLRSLTVCESGMRDAAFYLLADFFIAKRIQWPLRRKPRCPGRPPCQCCPSCRRPQRTWLQGSRGSAACSGNSFA